MTSIPLAITIDVDWAADAVLADTIELVEAHGLRATVFVTHETPVLSGLDPDKFEIALHPNLNRALLGEEDFRAPIDRLREQFPMARGIRSHSLVQGGPIWEYYGQCGFLWESNLHVPYHAPAYVDYNGVVRIPFGWSDAWAMLAGTPIDTPRIPGAPDGCGIYAFHPIHLYLNSESWCRYDEARAVYHDASELLARRNAGPLTGARDALVALAALARNSRSHPRLLTELAADVLDAQP